MNPVPRSSGAALRQARRLLECGEIPSPALVGVAVARSWRRCLEAGLAPTGRLPETPHLNVCQLAHAAERRQELLAHARPVMEYLHTLTRHTGSMVILADDRGLLLHAIGDTGFLSRAERVALMPGASWHELHRGTNGIGTALAEGAPVVVHGAEHYLERNGFLTCAAAPVMAPDGRFLGVVDISGDRRARHPHTFALVRAAVRMIENRLFDTYDGATLRLYFHPLAEGIGTLAAGMAALSEDGRIVAANQAGLALLGLGTVDLGITPLEAVLHLRLADLTSECHRRRGEPMLVTGPDGGRMFVRVDAGRVSRCISVSRTAEPPKDALAAIDTGDKCFKAAITKARKVMDKPIAVLLQGESGVGKGVFVRAMHDSGPRRNQPFVAVDCAALPESLIEAELFGYAPGAFTGARREGSKGRIREAHGGTLFLDEIGDMPPTLQGKLLRVLHERQVTPLGGGKPVTVDFALVCATHRCLQTEIEKGRFRADLYYRINGLTLMLPPLRERQDYPVLVDRLLEQGAPGRGVTLEADIAAAFADYRWPGNLRQLANTLRTACVLMEPEETRIGWQHLPDDIVEELRRPGRPGANPDKAVENLREISEAAIARAITNSQGNLSEASRRLGISRNTLYRRMKGGSNTRQQ